jgi:uncharacterized protein (DUF2141 family)
MANTLTITVTNLFSDSATVNGSLFNTEGEFPTGEKFKTFSGTPGAGNTEVQINIADLPDGQYAIALYQDINGNGKLDQNLLQIPTEPIGFSNNTFPKLRKPNWAECVLNISGGSVATSVQLYKMMGGSHA